MFAFKAAQRSLNLCLPQHLQLLHLVSLAPGVRAPLKFNDLRVQSHDLIVQMGHLCHLDDKQEAAVKQFY